MKTLLNKDSLISTAMTVPAAGDMIFPSCDCLINKLMRRDLAADYSRMMMEIAKFSEDGANIMIDHGWLEKMPGAVERRSLKNV
ncbi:DUF3231 family protein [Brevibacillus migulae]|uniref:DUF3231 family protein n=1 Tax=Brevibacillus migulae TaxID=1644114 RepID=UPI00106EEAEC|nr:DUF3231 family protein [Brevibacillus migulae]